MRKIFGLLLIFLSLHSGDNVNYCFISDASKHEKNQQILRAVLENELSSMDVQSPIDKANHLIERISHIAEELYVHGFSKDAYQVPFVDEYSIVSFNEFVLWEGKQIPVTFFIYVWPPKEFAQQYSSESSNSYYGSIIHSHPISCAFAVLEGIFIQRNYELVDAEKKTVNLTGEEVFHRFDAAIDQLDNPFIHQLYAKGMNSVPAITLHAYGLPTGKEVMDSFLATDALHSFTELPIVRAIESTAGIFSQSKDPE